MEFCYFLSFSGRPVAMESGLAYRLKILCFVQFCLTLGDIAAKTIIIA